MIGIVEQVEEIRDCQNNEIARAVIRKRAQTTRVRIHVPNGFVKESNCTSFVKFS